MTTKRRPGSIRRFGARYGRGVKLKYGMIEAEQRRYHPCPHCRAERVKRVAAGIWQCRKCGAKFAGRAYTVGTPRTKMRIEEPDLTIEPEIEPEELKVSKRADRADNMAEPEQAESEMGSTGAGTKKEEE